VTQNHVIVIYLLFLSTLRLYSDWNVPRMGYEPRAG
jgi:hypothetical protein